MPPCRTRTVRTAGAVVTALLAAGALAGCASGDGSGSDTAGDSGMPGGTSSSSVSPTSLGTLAAPPANDPRIEALTALLQRRAQAVADHDAPSWMSTVADPSSDFGRRQAAAYALLQQLPVSRLEVVSVTAAPQPTPSASGASAHAGSDRWSAAVRQSYQLDGYDTGPHEGVTTYTVVRTADGWRLADDDTAHAAQPWDLVGAQVVRTPTSLVIGNVSADQLADYSATADAAYREVASIWGSARPGVIVAPATLSELTAQLQRSTSDGLSQVAAVTDGPVSGTTLAVSDRVFVNPDAFAALTPAGRRAVLTHELTHVTIRASTLGTVPLWLSEGFADYVGFRDLSLPPTTLAADLLAQVRSGQGPTALPADRDFDPARTSVAPTYSAAWLAVSLIVQTYGEAKTVDFYRAVAHGSSVSGDPVAAASQAFGDVLGTRQEAFVAAWLDDLRRLSR